MQAGSRANGWMGEVRTCRAVPYRMCGEAGPPLMRAMVFLLTTAYTSHHIMSHFRSPLVLANSNVCIHHTYKTSLHLQMLQWLSSAQLYNSIHIGLCPPQQHLRLYPYIICPLRSINICYANSKYISILSSLHIY